MKSLVHIQGSAAKTYLIHLKSLGPFFRLLKHLFKTMYLDTLRTRIQCHCRVEASSTSRQEQEVTWQIKSTRRYSRDQKFRNFREFNFVKAEGKCNYHLEHEVKSRSLSLSNLNPFRHKEGKVASAAHAAHRTARRSSCSSSSSFTAAAPWPCHWKKAGSAASARE